DPSYPRNIRSLGTHISQPQLEDLTRQFLAKQLELDGNDLSNLLHVTGHINVYHSAIAMFYAPSDILGIRGMKRERIQCTPSWRGAP
ncbi:hypothetical protein BT96DRAFT_841709, partial [Gymnopus androsaceus JB14]